MRAGSKIGPGSNQDGRRVICVTGHEGIRDRGEGHAAVPAWDCAKAPSAQNFVRDEWHGLPESPAAPERQIVQRGAADDVLLIEIRVPEALRRPNHVADEAIAAD